MSTRTLLNLGLALLAVVLVLVVVYQPGLEPEPAPYPIVTGLDPQTVTRISVTRTAHGPITLSRHDDHWSLLSGERELPAAEFQVRALLRLLQATSTVAYPADDVNPAAVGLKPPQATLDIDGTQIIFGTTDPLEDRRYVQVADRIYLVEDQYQHLVTAESGNFIDRRLLAQGGSITGLELPDKTLRYTDTDGWQLEPDPGTAGADDLQQLVANWENATALYVSAADADAAAEETVHIQLREQEAPLEFRVISRTPDLILARPDWGIRYHLAGGLEESLFSLPAPETAPDSEQDRRMR
ncbi:MAG: DUF4340 domain-containing protein [Gammaproteobacteria bacterium]|jgi:hypothetical protein